VKPGTTFQRKVLVCNGNSSPLSVTMFGDGATIAHGTFALDQSPGRSPVAQWVSVSPTAFTLGPDSSRLVEATVQVPADTSAGEYYGGVVASHAPQSGDVGITARAAVRIYLAVGLGAAPKADFAVDTLTAARAADGTPYVQALVHNTGKRAIDLHGTLKLTRGPGGLSAGPFPAQLGTTLAPGQTEPVTVLLSKSIPNGPWLARIDLLSGLLERAAQGTVLFPSAAGTKAAPVKATSVSLAKNRPLIQGIAIGLLGLLVFVFLLLLLLWWRRRKRKAADRESAAATTAT
ncbi:MAG: peptidase, partial [Frankiales bacterium]|nr:peptidase [Frankiales bacterium]